MKILWCLIFLFVLIKGSVSFKIITSQENVLNSIDLNCVKCHPTHPKKLNVHLVHHSHDDVGWLKTVDQYFYGLNNSIANSGVQYVITSVVNALWDYPERKFIQVETAFFWKWWKEQDEKMRNKFRSLVNRGQIEIINGGWVMNDEACVNYQSTIDQFTWGFRILNETLGQCGLPKIGWQIDPFGHSREHASLISQMGFEALFFSRLDSYDKDRRIKDKALDFLWKVSANLNNTIFGGMFGTDNLYYPPSGFCSDVLCTDDTINDDLESPQYNLKDKVDIFLKDIKEAGSYFKTNNVLITMGGDFQYMSADRNFINTEKLMTALKNNTEVHLIYSTPSCYLKAVYESQPDLELEVKTDDFFPYSSANHSNWVGYFSSRPNFKRFERISHNVLQVSKQLFSFASAGGLKVNVGKLRLLREALGVAQHHDAITGTEKQHVTYDYSRQLSKGINDAEKQLSSIISSILSHPNQTLNIDIRSCHLTNLSICDISKHASKFLVTLYNPLTRAVNYTVHLPVNKRNVTVSGAQGLLSHDILQPISNFSYVKLNHTPAKLDLTFIARNIPPLGVQLYFVEQYTSEKDNEDTESVVEDNWTFGNEVVSFTIDNSTHLLSSVTMNNMTLNIKQEFMFYVSSNGTNDTDPSGAYIFRPNGTAKHFGKPQITHINRGILVDEVHQRVNKWITQVIRVYKNSKNYIEFDWLVGPIDISKKLGTEVITRFTVENFHNNQTFYTDSNGREMIKRQLNVRPGYAYNNSYEPVASNYYPITSKITIKDSRRKVQLSLLNDRSQGGTSLGNGQLELMVHRRTVIDDNKGVGEALNETEFGQGMVARGQVYLVFGPSQDVNSQEGPSVTAQERLLAQELLLRPWIGFANGKNMSIEELKNITSFSKSMVKKRLPENVNLLTLEPWSESTYLLRLEHIFEKNEDSVLSKDANINLKDLFDGLTVNVLEEKSLGGIASLNTRQYQWKTLESNDINHTNNVKNYLDETSINLTPMQIKTFIVEIVKK